MFANAPTLGSALIIIVLIAEAGCAERKPEVETQSVATPLDQVWAFDMPGTHDVRQLEPEKFGERTRELPSDDRSRLLHESMTYRIRAALGAVAPKKGERARSGFAVIGTGREALEGAFNVLAKGQNPDEVFPFDSNVTLVFFSHQCGQYVHLDRIEGLGKTIKVRYRFVPHTTADLTWHLALLPVGKLPLGRYEVEVTQSPGGKDPTGRIIGGLPSDQAGRFVCQSFSFSVVPRKVKQ